MVRRTNRRAGLTLVELLIVISVIVLLMAAAVPLLRMPLQDRKVREASRQLSSFIMRCKARAAELRRPVGLLLRRASSGQGDFVDRAYYSTQMYIVETPPPYTGDDSSAGASIYTEANPIPGQYTARLRGSQLVQFLAAAGDLIRFEYKGPYYRIFSIAADPMIAGAFIVTFTWPGHGTAAPPATTQANVFVPYQIYRSPYAGFSGPASMITNPPVELPNGVVIDLSVSGMGATDNQFYAATDEDSTAVILMFGPNGDVVRVYDSITMPGNPPTALLTDFDPSASIFLLIGRLEQVVPGDVFSRDPKPGITANLMDPSNIWVSIGHRTGKVTSAENGSLEAFAPPPGQPVPPALVPELFRRAREIARGSQNLGGR